MREGERGWEPLNERSELYGARAASPLMVCNVRQHTRGSNS
jgi:hypothetical protein